MNVWCFAAVLTLATAAFGAETQSAVALSEQGYAVPVSDLSVLEEAVADQLREVQSKLSAEIQAPEGDPFRAAALYGRLGRLYLAYELFKHAELAFGQGARLKPTDFRYGYYLAYAYERQGRLTEAVEAYERVVAMQPDFPPAQVRLARLYRETNRLELADALLTKRLVAAVQEQPALTALLAERGELRLAQGRAREAASDLELALAAVPNANRLEYPLAMAYRSLGQLEDARVHLARRGEAGLRFPDPELDSLAELTEGERVHLLRGKQAYGAGHFEAAVASFAKAVEAKPESVRARINFGTTLARLGDRNGALEQLRQAAELQPDNATVHYNLGLMLSDEGQWQSAASHLETAIRLNPDDLQARLALAKVLQGAGETEPALGYYQQVMQARPTVAEAWLGVAEILLSLGRYAEALQQLEQAHTRFPAEGRIAHWLARVLAASPVLELRDGPRAVELAQRVYGARKSVSHAETLAMALAETGQCDQAFAVQRQALVAARATEEQKRVEEMAALADYYESSRPCR